MQWNVLELPQWLDIWGSVGPGPKLVEFAIRDIYLQCVS